MSFGKRPSSAVSPTAQPSAETPTLPERRREAPDALMEGQTGRVLRQLGFEPKRETIVGDAAIDARVERGERALATRLALAEENAQRRFAEAQLRPYSLIPERCWGGESGRFLMASLDLYAHDDWNIVVLAAEERTAEVLDIAPYPSADVSAFINAAEKLLAEVQTQFGQASAEAELTQDEAAFADAREDMRLRIKGLAMAFARTLIEDWDARKPS